MREGLRFPSSIIVTLAREVGASMCVLPRERGARGRGLCSPVDAGGGKVSLSVGVIDEGDRPACDGRLKTAHILFTHCLI